MDKWLLLGFMLGNAHVLGVQLFHKLGYNRWIPTAIAASAMAAVLVGGYAAGVSM